MASARYALILVMLLSLMAQAAEPATQPTSRQTRMWKTIRGTILHDAARGKDLPVTLHVPAAPGPHPLIVFSHGAGGSGEHYATLLTGWANRGYVVIAPTHADSIALRTPEERRDMTPRELVVETLTEPRGWEDRVLDVKFVLDSLDELQRVVPEAAGKIDSARIGVAGHSYGAHTTQVIAGAMIRTTIGGELRSFADPRVKAALLMSGQGEGQMGLGEGSWDALKVPLMVMTGSEDKGAKGQDPMWRKAPFEHSPAGEKYWVFLHGATHMTFAGRLGDILGGGGVRRAGDRPGPDQKAIFRQVQRATIAFWDAYIKADDDAKKLLQSDELAEDPQVRVEFERR